VVTLAWLGSTTFHALSYLVPEAMSD
jgi:hypothetical protein